MDAGWIDHWGEALERLSRRLFFASLGILATAALASLILPRGSQMLLGALLERSQESYRVSLPTADGSFSIKIRQLPLFYDEFRYRPSVFRTTERADESLGSRGSWDGLTPMMIYEQGTAAIVIRMRGRGYDTYGPAEPGVARRYLGQLRMVEVRGQTRFVFVDGRAVHECNPDAEVEQGNPLPSCTSRR